MAELIDVANAMFKSKSDWKNISDFDKERFAFIFNRYFSKRYTQYSQFLNNKNIDKVELINLWYVFMSNKQYPAWFWTKSEKRKNESLDKSDFNLLIQKLNLNKIEDLEYLIEHFPDLIQDELKFYKTKTK
jgi:hypothetical protein